MGFFNNFGKKGDESNVLNISLPVSEPAEAKANIENVGVGQKKENDDKKTLTVSYATGWPIDVIYGYLQKDYGKKGFDDAMLKSDLVFRDMNMNLIKNKILMVFREINLKYDVMSRDFQAKIENCNSAGLLATASELNNLISTINAHKEELRQLEADFRNNMNDASIPLLSYNCGFLRGIATVQMSGTGGILQSPVIQNVGDLSKGIA